MDSGPKSEARLARVTWNRDGWRLPSGFIKRGEVGTYVGSHGYGHEEWLNRSEWTVNGWRYAYVEGVSRAGEKLRGRKLDLLLFAINPGRQRVVVGYISPAEVLDVQLAESAHAEFKKRGWLKTMVSEVRERTGDVKKFAKDVDFPFSVANIRWKSEMARFAPNGAGVRKNDRIVSSSRYGLRRVPDAYLVAWKKRLIAMPDSAVVHELTALEGTLTTRLVRHRQREAALRIAKLEDARALSPDGRLRCEVPRCGFDFEKVYGPLGAGYAQVHHLQPLGGQMMAMQTTLRDLAVVCANCHAMIHSGGKCRSLSGLIPRRKP